MTLGNLNNQSSDLERYHWYQNAQNLFWKSPIWEVKTRFDHEFNERLLDEIYGIGKDIYQGRDRDPSNSIWDYSRPCLDELKQEIIDIVTREIVRNIPEIRMLNLSGCEHFMGWINVREPGERLEVHGHTESAIAATYYLRAEENCGDLVLYDTAGAIDWNNNTLSGSPYVRERRLKPVEGHLVFFPSYVLHGVDENRSNDLRISLSTDLRKVVDKNSSNTVILKSWATRMAKIRDWSNVSKT
jgi:hypothetical protein